MGEIQDTINRIEAEGRIEDLRVDLISLWSLRGSIIIYVCEEAMRSKQSIGGNRK